MKDAKGHGSEKRGHNDNPFPESYRQHALWNAAHQVGVAKIPVAPQVSPAALAVIRAGHEGFSVTPSGQQPTSGHMVAMPGRTAKIDAADLAGPRGHDIVSQHVMTHSDVYSNPNVHLGGWMHEGKMLLEPSENIRSRSAAIKAGRERNQIAIWDVKRQREIPTGGTGK